MNSKLIWCVVVLLTVLSAKSAIASNSPDLKPIYDEPNPNFASNGLNGHLAQVQEFVMRLLETLRSFMTNFNKTLTEESDVNSLQNPIVRGRLYRRGNPPAPAPAVKGVPTGKPDNSKKPTPPPNAWKPREDEAPGDFGSF